MLSNIDNYTSSQPMSHKKRKRKPYYIPVNSMPRILKRDIRRDFATMITNVYNSGDESLITQFFGQFCVPNFQSVLFSRSTNATKPKIQFTTGLKTAIVRTITNLSAVPDLIFQLEKAQIVRRPDFTGSQIHLQMNVNCTPLFMEELGGIDSNSEDVQLHHKLVHCYGSISDTHDTMKDDHNISYVIPNTPMLCSGDPAEMLEEANRLLRSRAHALEPCWVCQAIHNKFLESPVSYSGVIDINVILDEEHRICRMEFQTT